MSLPREELFQRAIWGLDQQFKGHKNTPEYRLIKYLWHQIIFDNPIDGVKRKGKLDLWEKLPKSKSLFCQKPGRGIVIGNLTSQLLSNIYLDQLDQYVTKNLGYKYYGRYVDDFYIVVTEEQLPQLKKDIHAIEVFLMTKKLTLHPQKRYLQESSKGVAFLGAVIYPNRIVAGKRLVKNIRKAFAEISRGEKDTSTAVSYLGHVKHFNSYKMMKREFEAVGWVFQ